MLKNTQEFPEPLDKELSPLPANTEQFHLEEAEDPEPHKSDRQLFYELHFSELDRDLTPEERQEWNSIYASYRGRSSLRGTIIGVDQHSVKRWDRQTGESLTETMYCAIVIPYRIRVVIPETELWVEGAERPQYVLQNMVGATVDFIIIKVEREAGFAIGSRRLASLAKRRFLSRRPALHQKDAHITCHVLAVGPRRCLVDCYGYDLDLRQRDMRYTPTPDLRAQYHPGTDLDCIVKEFDAEQQHLVISVKEATVNPFDGAMERHPEGSRRMATISGKYGGGVFCNLPDETVCLCNYSYQHEDSEFQIGDTVILVIQRHDLEKKLIFGKILALWHTKR